MIHARHVQNGMGHRWAPSILGAALLAATGATAVAQDARRPEFEPISDNRSLPRVLVIGDSISIGYTLPLREALQGVANVHRPPENCQHTWRGLEAIDDWLGAGNWDLIHFNWGLHDLKYVDKDGRRVSPAGEGKQGQHGRGIRVESREARATAQGDRCRADLEDYHTCTRRRIGTASRGRSQVQPSRGAGHEPSRHSGR